MTAPAIPLHLLVKAVRELETAGRLLAQAGDRHQGEACTHAAGGLNSYVELHLAAAKAPVAEEAHA